MVGQAVTGINLQAQAGGIGGRFGNTLQLFCLLGVGFGIGIAAGVDFDIGAPTSAAALICASSASINSETRIPASRRAGIAHFVALARHVQTAFGGHFLTFFRHQAAEVRFGLTGDRQHLFGDRHLKIHAGIQRLAQDTHIAIGNMATVFAQMHGNAVGAGLLGDKGRLNRIRISGAASVTQCRNMVNIDP
jgi:hypothetical protein